MITSTDHSVYDAVNDRGAIVGAWALPNTKHVTVQPPAYRNEQANH